jgi:hypothetical protein
MAAQGEGEVKILSRLIRPWAAVTAEDTHAIIATDSDVVLMALVTPVPNVYVLAEPSRQAQQARAKLVLADAAAASAHKKGGGSVGGRGARAKAAGRGLPITRGFTCFSVSALHSLWLQRYTFLRGANAQVGTSLAQLRLFNTTCVPCLCVDKVRLPTGSAQGLPQTLPLVGLARSQQGPISRGHGAQYLYRPPPARVDGLLKTLSHCTSAASRS